MPLRQARCETGDFLLESESVFASPLKMFFRKKAEERGDFFVNDFYSKKIHKIVTISLAALASNDYVANPAEEKYWAE